jgi:hypothetical protein
MTQTPTKESQALAASLAAQRNHVLGILEGLSEEDLQRPVLPSQWTCAGLVHHLAIDVERFWFRAVVAGEPMPDEPDNAWQVPAGLTAAAVLGPARRRSSAWWPDTWRPPRSLGRDGPTGEPTVRPVTPTTSQDPPDGQLCEPICRHIGAPGRSAAYYQADRGQEPR